MYCTKMPHVTEHEGMDSESLQPQQDARGVCATCAPMRTVCVRRRRRWEDAWRHRSGGDGGGIGGSADPRSFATHSRLRAVWSRLLRTATRMLAVRRTRPACRILLPCDQSNPCGPAVVHVYKSPCLLAQNLANKGLVVDRAVAV